MEQAQVTTVAARVEELAEVIRAAAAQIEQAVRESGLPFVSSTVYARHGFPKELTVRANAKGDIAIMYQPPTDI